MQLSFKLDPEDEAILKLSWHMNAQGYVARKQYPERRTVLQHRVVMERVLGRSLASGEIVHHVNGDRTDNRRTNLEVVTRSSHGKIHGFNGVRPKRESSPTRGIYKIESKRWGSRFQLRRNGIHYGTFNTFEEAERYAATQL